MEAKIGREFVLQRLSKPGLRYGDAVMLIAGILEESAATFAQQGVDGFSTVRMTTELDGAEVTVVAMREPDFKRLHDNAWMRNAGRIDADGVVHGAEGDAPHG